MKSRTNELTGVLNRNLFDLVPGSVETEQDRRRWVAFRKSYHQAQRLDLWPDFPLQLDFELNSTCNLSCSFCVHGYKTVAKYTLSFELFKKAINEGARHGLCSIKMNYINEPLLVRDFVKYVQYARSKGVLNVFFATNGILLNEHLARQLVEAKVSKIMISLDAATSETYFKMRKSKKFGLIVRNIHRLIRLRDEMGEGWPLVRVNFLKTHLNIHEADDFIKQWTDVADMIGFQDQVGLPGIDAEALPDYDVAVVLPLANDKTTFRCSFPFKLMVIDAVGNLLPCCTFSGRQMALGNIRDMSIADAWTARPMRYLKVQQARGEWTNNAICSHCINSTGAVT